MGLLSKQESQRLKEELAVKAETHYHILLKYIDFLKRRSPELVKCDKLQATKVVVLDFSVI